MSPACLLFSLLGTLGNREFRSNSKEPPPGLSGPDVTGARVVGPSQHQISQLYPSCYLESDSATARSPPASG